MMIAALVALFAISGLHAVAAQAAPRAEVTFVNPDDFSDAANAPRGSSSGLDQNLNSLRAYIVERSNLYIPEGQKLTVKVTDVDLAGEYEPWQSGRLQNIRVVKFIYAPRIELSFKLTDTDGAILKEGTRSLRDPNFMLNRRLATSDPREYEKAMLDDWLRGEFARTDAR